MRNAAIVLTDLAAIGLARTDTNVIFSGAIPDAVLTIAVDLLLGAVKHLVVRMVST